MDKVIKKVTASGLPGVVLSITMAARGLTGAAAIAVALTLLGEIAGMLDGITVFRLTGLILSLLNSSRG
jgi:hypothetical protein